jgi:hypothetical protein
MSWNQALTSFKTDRVNVGGYGLIDYQLRQQMILQDVSDGHHFSTMQPKHSSLSITNGYSRSKD